jgi:hypothetical protein
LTCRRSYLRCAQARIGHHDACASRAELRHVPHTHLETWLAPAHAHDLIENGTWIENDRAHRVLVADRGSPLLLAISPVQLVAVDEKTANGLVCLHDMPLVHLER